MDNLTLITCSYNTPQMTLTMLKSFVSVHDNNNFCQSLMLIDNSTNSLTKNLLETNKIPYISNPGNTHGHGINKCLELCKTDYALLVDTDIIFLKSHVDVFEQFKSMDLTLMGKIEGDRGGKKIYKRVNPWHCFINVKYLKEHNIMFFDEPRMKQSFSTNCIYDIGSTCFEDVVKNKLKIGNIDLHNDCYIHFEGMSWYKNKFDPSQEDTGIDFGGTHNNISFVRAYEQKERLYKTYEQQYENVVVLNKFYNN